MVLQLDWETESGDVLPAEKYVAGALGGRPVHQESSSGVVRQDEGGNVPRVIPEYRRRLLDRTENLPAMVVQRAVLLSVDIVGFTAITDEIVRSSRLGAEEVASATHAVLDEIGKIAGSWGGEISSFAGDSILVCWFIGEPFAEAMAVQFAAAAATEVTSKSQSWRIGPLPIRVRTSIATGPVRHAEVGGFGGQWLSLLTGVPFDELAVGDRLAGPGEIVVAPDTWSVLETTYKGEQRSGGFRALGQMRSIPAQPAQLETEPVPDRVRPDVIAAPVSPYSADALAGHWHGEFHGLSIVFARLTPKSVSDLETVDTLNTLAQVTQAVASELDGIVYQLLADRGAIAAICLFGLPPNAHADDPARAILAALALERRLATLQFRADIGVTTGRVFCTIHGNAGQAEFAVAGPAINLAARLAASGLGVLGDPATVKSALVRYDLGTRELPPLILKGKAEAVSPYLLFEQPKRRLPAEGNAAGVTLAGRAAEMSRAETHLTDLLNGKGSVLTIEGEAGIGKTALAVRLMERAAESGILCLTGLGDEIEGNSRYHPWRAVFAKLLGSGGAPSFQEGLARRGPVTGDTALIEAAMEVTPSDEASSGLSDEGRDELTRRLLTEQLVAASERAPIVVLLEDYHWFDPSSRRLLTQLAEARARVLVVVTTRPVAHDDYERLVTGGGTTRLTLGPLSFAESIETFGAFFGADRVAPDLGEMILRRTGGNPLFIGELARLLKDNDAVEVTAGELVGKQDSGVDQIVDEILRSSGAPATIEGLVMARLNRVPAGVRRLVGVASVFGRAFNTTDLLAVAQCKSDELEQFLASDLVVASDGNLYAFRHAVLRDVAYHALSHRDRRDAHGKLAVRLEAGDPGQAGRLDELLAHHFDEAGQAERALFYMLRAGRQELYNSANREAHAHFARAVELLREPGNERLAAASLVEAELGLGEAAQRLSSYPEAEQYKSGALRSLGTTIPRKTPALVLAILREVGVQVLHRRAPEDWWHRGGTSDSERIGLELGTLVEVYFYLGKSFHSLYAALKALNVAELAGPSGALSRAFALIGTMTGFVGLSDLGKRYCERALSVLTVIDDPAAAWWVPLAVGIARMSAGDLAQADALFATATERAEKTGERRYWRDAVENTGIVAAMRGDWNGALNAVAKYRASAMADRDRRYLVAALREQAYYLLQLGYYNDADDSLKALRAEVDRGIKAEAEATRLDLHSIAGMLALARGDRETAAREGEAAMLALASIGGATSFPNMHWAMLLLARLNAGLWTRGQTASRDVTATHLRRGKLINRAIQAHAAAHPVARPAAQLSRGLLELVRGNDRGAAKRFASAASLARSLGLAHETALADRLLKSSNAASDAVPSDPRIMAHEDAA